MEWQPIETAPKDGTEILGVYLNGKYDPEYSIIEWDGKGWVGKCEGFRAIEREDDFHVDYFTPYCTHWMPLPKAPKGVL